MMRSLARAKARTERGGIIDIMAETETEIEIIGEILDRGQQSITDADATIRDLEVESGGIEVDDMQGMIVEEIDHTIEVVHLTYGEMIGTLVTDVKTTIDEGDATIIDF